MSVAPGLVDTQMQDYLRNEVDVKEFPSSSYFIESKENGMTKSPDEIAKKIIKLAPTLFDFGNGSFVDLRGL
jgi:NAD(P)-dependent dehydrogenase (short-subunit alcohol dehydrogenase family)